jgi:threonylcarbamoyladenosine tRNA methylthiotransferase MtaB
MHLPMQSGSDSVLKRMSRRCKTDEFRTLVKQARQRIPNINITSDIIVGFPGETEEEWQQTLAFVEEMKFGDLHIFTYSTRDGTKAATMPNQVRNETKKLRSKQLHELAESIKASNMSALVGSTLDVLWEDAQQQNDDGSSVVFGYTPNYLRVKTITNKPEKVTNFIKVCKLTSIESNVFNAELV